MTEFTDGWDNAADHYYTNPCDPDSDDDGITDLQERDFDSHPHLAISGYSIDNNHKSYNVFQQPDLWWFPTELREYQQQQQWRWELTKANDRHQRGMFIKGQVWGPEMFWFGTAYDPAHPLPVQQWANWGSIEIELLTWDLIEVNNGVIQIDLNFHLFIEPNRNNNLPRYNANLKADLDLKAEWTLLIDKPLKSRTVSLV